MTIEQKIEQCRNINWYALTNDQLDHILEIAGMPIENLKARIKSESEMSRSPFCTGCEFPKVMCHECYAFNFG